MTERMRRKGCATRGFPSEPALRLVSDLLCHRGGRQETGRAGPSTKPRTERGTVCPSKFRRHAGVRTLFLLHKSANFFSFPPRLTATRPVQSVHFPGRIISTFRRSSRGPLRGETRSRAEQRKTTSSLVFSFRPPQLKHDNVEN